ncbi:MAG: glycoside hydrolase family 3 C-terminal domain-containing protein, partial [Blastococcus sp.]|nr:glycoside hydrolase family 3 C-terminal domain-containing protein [Blastococcus sp.]
KHFAANNAETDRMRVSADVDARTLREVYLRAFERVVTRAQPWTVMCSYNRINGVYAAENEWLLSTVLRGEWGFDGVVVSDWGAVRDRVAAVRAGLDLEMPGTGARTNAMVLAAAEADDAVRTTVERAAERIARLAARAARPDGAPGAPDLDAHHALAREVAGRAVVLLQNEGDLLPLAPGASLAVVGEFARTPRYQGGGSSRVNATRVDVPLEEIRALAGTGAVTFAPGFALDGSGDAASLRAEAVAASGAADSAVVFLGLTEEDESEGFDRTHLDLPPEQLELLRAVVAVQRRTVVVLAHGGVVRLTEVAAAAPAVLDAALLGQAGGGAVADVLFGAVNPSGRLAETVPLRLEDVPAFPGYPGEHGHDSYGERVFVGHRWYDARGLDVAFPLGHGLSYTTFGFTDLELTSSDAGVTVGLTVTNTGSRSGREVVQVYAGLPTSEVARPPRSLA